MTEIEAYLDFRKTIDSMFYPIYRNTCDVTVKKDEKGNVIGLLLVERPMKYISCLWVAPEHRGNGLGYELVVEHMLKHGRPEILHILNNNYKAKAFWDGVFKLQVADVTAWDTLYYIQDVIKREAQ